MHTMARVKNSSLSRDQPVESDLRERGEAAIVRSADVLTANTPDEAAELCSHYRARAEQIMIVPPGVDLHTFHPCNQPKSRAQFGVAQDIQVILFVGRIQPLKAPDVLIKAVAELTRRDPSRRDRLQLIIIGGPSGSNGEWSQTLGPLAIDHGIEDMVDFRPLGTLRAVPLVLRLRRRCCSLLQRVFRTRCARGTGVWTTSGRSRCRRPPSRRP